MRNCVEDLKEEIIRIRGKRYLDDKKHSRTSSATSPVTAENDPILDRFIGAEKLLTLVYDKTFYPDPKPISLDELRTANK